MHGTADRPSSDHSTVRPATNEDKTRYAVRQERFDVRASITAPRLFSPDLGAKGAGQEPVLLDPQAADRPGNHQLLDLLRAFENVEGMPMASGVSRWVRDQRFSPRENGPSRLFRPELVTN